MSLVLRLLTGSEVEVFEYEIVRLDVDVERHIDVSDGPASLIHQLQLSSECKGLAAGVGVEGFPPPKKKAPTTETALPNSSSATTFNDVSVKVKFWLPCAAAPSWVTIRISPV